MREAGEGLAFAHRDFLERLHRHPGLERLDGDLERPILLQEPEGQRAGQRAAGGARIQLRGVLAADVAEADSFFGDEQYLARSGGWPRARRAAARSRPAWACGAAPVSVSAKVCVPMVRPVRCMVMTRWPASSASVHWLSAGPLSASTSSPSGRTKERLKTPARVIATFKIGREHQAVVAEREHLLRGHADFRGDGRDLQFEPAVRRRCSDRPAAGWRWAGRLDL